MPPKITSGEYADKYNIPVKRLAPACRVGALESEKVIEVSKSGAPTAKWMIVDKPPKEHPNWQEYEDSLHDHSPEISGRVFVKKAPEYLKRFDAARVQLDITKFTQTQVAKMLHTQKSVIWRWTEIGVDGFGKLPRIKLSKDKGEKYSNMDAYYDTKDIRRFLKGELKDPTKEFKTIDDVTEQTTRAEIAAKHGYFVYDPEKVYSMDYEGFRRWATENVRREDKAAKCWVPFIPIAIQLEAYREVWALDEDGRLKNRFIRLCRPRGDFKSFDAILIFLFRFFNMHREKILLAANSKDQSDYALYDEAKDIVLNSPKLMSTPGLEVKKDEMVLMAGKTEEFNKIKSIPSKHGTLSNATCVVFSEIYKQKDQNFIVELEGSIRTVPNAMSIIESTVSKEGTYYHRQYKQSIEGKSPKMYFQYYCDVHHNPDMTQEELDQYKASFFPEEFKMFFRNRWGDAGEGLFSDRMIYEMGVAGFNGVYGPSQELTEAIRELLELQRKFMQYRDSADTSQLQKHIKEITSKIITIDSIYSLPAEPGDLEKLQEVFKCSEFFLGVGLDRAEQLSPGADRSSLITTAKGFLTDDIWYGFVLDVYLPPDSAQALIKNRIIENQEKYGYISKINIEKLQGLDLVDWFNTNGFEAELVPASYESQKQFFLELYKLAYNGYLKCPAVPLWVDDEGKMYYDQKPPEDRADILRDEMKYFEHQVKADRKVGWFGSAFKKSGRTKKGEAKDDTIFGLGHSVMAANTGDVPASALGASFSGATLNKDVLGDWAVTT